MCLTRIFDQIFDQIFLTYSTSRKKWRKTSSIWIWIHYFWGTSLNFGFAYRLSSSITNAQQSKIHSSFYLKSISYEKRETNTTNTKNNTLAF